MKNEHFHKSNHPSNTKEKLKFYDNLNPLTIEQLGKDMMLFPNFPNFDMSKEEELEEPIRVEAREDRHQLEGDEEEEDEEEEEGQMVEDESQSHKNLANNKNQSYFKDYNFYQKENDHRDAIEELLALNNNYNSNFCYNQSLGIQPAQQNQSHLLNSTVKIQPQKEIVSYESSNNQEPNDLPQYNQTRSRKRDRKAIQEQKLMNTIKYCRKLTDSVTYFHKIARAGKFSKHLVNIYSIVTKENNKIETALQHFFNSTMRHIERKSIVEQKNGKSTLQTPTGIITQVAIKENDIYIVKDQCE